MALRLQARDCEDLHAANTVLHDSLVPAGGMRLEGSVFGLWLYRFRWELYPHETSRVQCVVSFLDVERVSHCGMSTHSQSSNKEHGEFLNWLHAEFTTEDEASSSAPLNPSPPPPPSPVGTFIIIDPVEPAAEPAVEPVRAVIEFEFIIGRRRVVAESAIEGSRHEARQGPGRLHIVFSGGALLRLRCRGLAMVLEDIGEPWPVPWTPRH